MTRQSAESIEDEAAEWLARLDRYGRTSELVAELQLWLQADTRRHGALLQAQAAWTLLNQHFDTLDVEVHGKSEDSGSSIGDLSRSRFLSRRSVIGGAGAIAASLVAGIAILNRGERFSTRTGEIRRVPLADGSIVAINTQSQVRVDLQPETRLVQLGKGEVWFQVAKDRTRPFVVEAGRARVRAVGTAFAVRRYEDGSEVFVTEGVVEAWLEGGRMRPLRLGVGQKARFTEKSIVPNRSKAPEEIDRVLAWRSGRIDLAGESLSHAIAEFNRYNERKIVLADQSVASEPLFGVFRTDDPKGFADAVHHGLGVSVNFAQQNVIQIGK